MLLFTVTVTELGCHVNMLNISSSNGKLAMENNVHSLTIKHAVISNDVIHILYACISFTC